MDMATQVQKSTNILMKSMNPLILLPAIGK